MITRIWHGWTTPENAPLYRDLLLTEILPGIADHAAPGYLGISLIQREVGDEVEFVTLMYFTSLDAIRAFAGETYDVAVVPPSARALLKRFDERSAHYDTLVPPPAAALSA